MTENEFTRYWELLIAKKHKGDTLPLTSDEALFYAANWLRGSVPRSGFIGYFEGSSGEDVIGAVEAFRLMNLSEPLSLLQGAILTIFGEMPLPNDSVPLDVLPSGLSESEYESASDELDHKVTPIEVEFNTFDNDIYVALCRFADERLIKDLG